MGRGLNIKKKYLPSGYNHSDVFRYTHEKRFYLLYFFKLFPNLNKNAPVLKNDLDLINVMKSVLFCINITIAGFYIWPTLATWLWKIQWQSVGPDWKMYILLLIITE